MKDKILLITAFEPFGGESVNAAQAAVDLLPRRIGGWTLCKRTVPVIFGKGAEAVICAAEEVGAQGIVCVGQAAGRDKVTPEYIAVNLQYASVPDNAGNLPSDLPILPDGPAAYFSTLPVRKMAEAIRGVGLPGAVSYSAGAYVCNDVFYRVLHRFSGSGVAAGFIHVPQTPAQGEPSLPAEVSAKALECALRAWDETEENV